MILEKQYSKSLTKDSTYYLSLPYAVEIRPLTEAEGGGFHASIPRLGRYSAVGDGETAEAAYADLRAALPSLISGWLTQGVPIPQPAPEGGVSINPFIATTLAQAGGH